MYVRWFGSAYFCCSEKSCAFVRIINDDAGRHGIMHEQDQVFAYLHSIERDGATGQMSFFT
jgi:hypothetical protein